jgi:hypothetical protein
MRRGSRGDGDEHRMGPHGSAVAGGLDGRLGTRRLRSRGHSLRLRCR